MTTYKATNGSTLIIEPAGYGNYILRTTYFNKPIAMHTTDSQLIDNITDGMSILNAIKKIRKNYVSNL